jgi:hypothetical protein
MKKSKSLLIVLLWILLSSFVFGTISLKEREALIKFYASTNGDSWTDNSGWKAGGTFAPHGTEHLWFGITIAPVAATGSAVTKISLFNNNLVGTIPEQIGEFKHLTDLNLSNNHLSGPIPEDIGNLEQLWYLELQYNQLTGKIPKEIGNLKKIRFINLTDNKLGGTIPPEIGQLTYLEYLSLISNSFHGGIPKEIGNLGHLQALALGRNKLSGDIPGSLSNLAKLWSLYLAYNALYTKNTNLKNFLGKLDPDWESTQTIAPENLTATAQSSSEVNITWTPILFNSLAGRYRVYYSTKPGEPYSEFGQTLDKDASHMTATGLLPGKTYYFVVRSQTDPHIANQNNIYSCYSQEVGATTPVGLKTIYGLVVESEPYLGAAITVSPPDENSKGDGQTSFFRLYPSGKTVSLTAPSNHIGYPFEKWLVAGKEYTTNNIQIKMNDETVAVARYQVPTLQGLWILSNGCEGVPISLDPIDGHGLGSGTTPFFREYETGKKVKLTAPQNHEDFSFSYWEKDGKQYNNPIIEFTTDKEGQALAFYTKGGSTAISLNHNELYYGATTSGLVTSSQRLLINNSGTGTLQWNIAADATWISLTPHSGTGPGIVSVIVNPSGLSPGTYSGTITVTAIGAINSPQDVRVDLTMYPAGSSSLPKGNFSTPVDGSTLRSSIPVTGWVIDDIEVTDVKIYNGPHYVGDAVFVEGARPDVEAAYPGYPKNYQAGWGYMMLTNFLPNGGNGTYTIVAKATDAEGCQLTLGSKNITVDNVHAVKPFGAIDTPAQGGSVSGSNFVNWGWVLTPQPNHIPHDGSTINVWVDGVNLGHPTYNIYRPDIDNLFPGYGNSTGAVGYFNLDTTGYTNGIHSIQWTATDNANNSDGIGSRYFTVLNSGISSNETKISSNREPIIHLTKNLSPTHKDYSRTIRIKKGFNNLSESTIGYPDPSGDINIKIKELERVEIDLGYHNGFAWKGFLKNEEKLKLLPIGSSLNKRTGIFSWIPGPGFYGLYNFVFIRHGRKGILEKIFVNIQIKPKF